MVRLVMQHNDPREMAPASRPHPIIVTSMLRTVTEQKESGKTRLMNVIYTKNMTFRALSILSEIGDRVISGSMCMVHGVHV